MDVVRSLHMYLRGSKLSYTRRRRRTNPLRILILVLLVGAAVYINAVIVPSTSPLFVPTPTPTRSPESFVTEAENFLTSGKVSQAISSYTSAIQSDPKNPSNFISLARLEIYSGKYAEAVVNAENALLLNPNNSTAHAVRGWALGFQGEYLQAEGALNKAIELDANNAVAYAYLAEVIGLKYEADLGDIGSLDQAIEASRTAVQLAPDIMESHRARGYVLELTQNNEEAVVEFETASSYNPNVADLHLAMGRNYRALQQYDKAVEEFNRAVSLNPGDPEPLLYISRTYAAVGEYTKGIQYGLQAIKISPEDAYLYGNVGVLYYRNRSYPDAISNLRLAVRGGKNEDGIEVKGLTLDYGRVAEYYYIYGLALARSGECGEAIQISQLISQGVGNDETAVFNAQEMINICMEGTRITAVPTGENVDSTSEAGGVETTPTP